jgi:hypothetical protein
MRLAHRVRLSVRASPAMPPTIAPITTIAISGAKVLTA